MAVGRTPEERFFEIIKKLEDRINQLEARPTQIPIVDSDPPTNFAGNIWMFQDGRIHLRLSDGSIQEIQGSSSSGGTSGTPKPPVPPQPVQQMGEWSATWSQAYRQAGGFTGGDAESLYYGNSGESTYNGRQSSLVGFDYAAIQAALAGSTINKVEIYLYNKWTWGNSGGTVHFGLHNAAAKPSTFGMVVASFVSNASVKRSTGDYHTVSTQFGAMLRDGTAKGIVLQSPNNSTAFYGYAAGVGDGPPVPRIRITHTK